MYECIVAGTDGSDTARVATDRAALLAKKLGAELVLVHAGSRADRVSELGESYGAEVVARSGEPAEVLIGEVDRLGAGLLVVGSVGMRGTRRWLLGSVPNKVSHHAGTDVLIVRTDPAPKEIVDYRGILVGTDGSPTAMRAVDMSCRLSRSLGVAPLIVCAYEPPTERELEQLRADPNDPIAQWDADDVVRETPEEFRWRIAGASQAEDVLDRAAEHAASSGVEAEVKAVEGAAAEVLLQTAEGEGVDVTAVGSVGMSGQQRFMLGNVPNRISHQARTDVLILRTT